MHALETVLAKVLGQGPGADTHVTLVLELLLREDLLMRKAAGRRVCHDCRQNYNLVDIVEPDQGIYMPAMPPKVPGPLPFGTTTSPERAGVILRCSGALHSCSVGGGVEYRVAHAPGGGGAVGAPPSLCPTRRGHC